jgi:hypothetical protein
MIGDGGEIGGMKIGKGNRTCPSDNFVHHESHMTRTVFEPGPRGGKPATIFLLLLVGWDFWYCGHYWPIVPAPDDR